MSKELFESQKKYILHLVNVGQLTWRSAEDMIKNIEGIVKTK